MLPFIYSLSSWIMWLSLHMLRFGKKTRRTKSKKEWMGSLYDSHCTASIPGTFLESSSAAGEIFQMVDCGFETPESLSFNFYKIMVLISFLYYFFLLYSANKNNKRIFSKLQGGGYMSRKIPKITNSIELHGGAASRSDDRLYFTQNNSYLDYSYESDDSIDVQFHHNNGFLLEEDMSFLQGNSIRFRPALNTGLFQDDFKTTRSAAISLLLWDSK